MGRFLPLFLSAVGAFHAIGVSGETPLECIVRLFVYFDIIMPCWKEAGHFLRPCQLIILHRGAVRVRFETSSRTCNVQTPTRQHVSAETQLFLAQSWNVASHVVQLRI